MVHLALLVKALDTAHWELGEAFKGMPDADLWRRPHDRLWSVGELGAHLAHGLDENILGGTAGGPLVAAKVSYYDAPLGEPLTLPMTPSEIYDEIMRIANLAKAKLESENPEPDAQSPYRSDWTWRQTVEYMAFHAAYHTGQIYSARHIFGHETEDN